MGLSNEPEEPVQVPIHNDDAGLKDQPLQADWSVEQERRAKLKSSYTTTPRLYQ